MVDTHGLADDLGALGVFLVVLQAHLAERVEDAAMNRLETIACIGERAPDDDAHRVVEIGAAHLLLDVDGDHVRSAVWGRSAFERELWVLIVCHRVFVGSREGGKSGPE
jgi:hypothetical protein